jgi:hypothetical protein
MFGEAKPFDVFWFERLCGTACSIADWITFNGITTGVTISELRVIGGNGETSSSFGGRSTE